jgi:twitching motility protein PilT
MPNQSDQNQQTGANPTNSYQANNSPSGVMGYVSPYSDQNSPFTQLQSNTQTDEKQSQTQDQSLQRQENINGQNPDIYNLFEDSPENVNQARPQIDPGNILDNPEHVQAILENKPVPQLQNSLTVAREENIQANEKDASQERINTEMANFSLPPQQFPSTNNEYLNTTLTVETPSETSKQAQQLQNTQNTYIAPKQKQNEPNLHLRQQDKVEINPENDLKAGVVVDALTQKYTKISELLDIVIQRNASDLHISVGYPPYIRVDDRLIAIGANLTKEEVKNFISQTLSQNQKELLEVNREVDLSYQHEDKGRFRINAYYEKGNLAGAYRLIPQKIRSITELGLPSNLLDFTRVSQGLFLVTGPTGSGKSTTLAAMIQHINESYPKHIITIEDPIEYVYPRAMALVDQRELGSDTHDWSIALKSALRQDPDVILIGELRDFDTIQSAITLAETGHLVFATLHTNSAAQSIDRIIDVFPPHQQDQIRTQLAGSLKGILSQRLIPLIGGRRKAVIELLIVTPAVQNLIREGKTYQIDNVIATSADLGMIGLEKSLVKLVREGKITTATAQEYAIRPEEILKLMKNNQL